MTISTLADYEAARKQLILFQKNTIAVTSSRYMSMSKTATGTPPVFSTVSSAGAGVVPVAGDTGFPVLDPFGSGVGRVSALEARGTIGVRVLLYDRLFHSGPYNVNNESTSLASQPSFSSRIPGGTDYTNLQLWVESNSASGTPTCTITYTDQDNNTGSSTAFTMPTMGGVDGSSVQVPLAAGDSGLRKVESVATTATGSGTFNLFVARPLAYLRLEDVQERRWSMEELGLPELFATSALGIMLMSASTNSGTIEVGVEIAIG